MKSPSRYTQEAPRRRGDTPLCPPGRDVSAVTAGGSCGGRPAVLPDLVFALPTPPHDAGDPRTVGVGVMAYYGGNDDRWNADEIHARYLENMKRFVRWLADSGHRIRLFT